MYRIAVSFLLTVAFFQIGTTVHAQSFSDVPKDHPTFAAIESLKKAGVLQGYEDGTFQPEKSVNRAEAVKIIIAPLLTEQQLAQATETVYDDIPNGAWYVPYVEWARQGFGIIDGPPSKTSFYGENTVILVEFLKMLELANGVEPVATFGEIKLPLSKDTPNTNEWYYPYIRYAYSASMLTVDENGKLNPARELTRADTAQLLYTFLLYNQNKRLENLFTKTEASIVQTIKAWENGLLTEAEYASARALLAARGAHAMQPDDPVAQGVVKIAEGYRSLVRGYRAGASGNYVEAERLAGEAWGLADEAVERSNTLVNSANQIRTIAKAMADSSRLLQAEQ